MSSEKAFYLTVVFEYANEMIRATSNFMEEDVRRELDDMGICSPADRKEVQVSYQVELPLFPEWIARLLHLKTMGMITGWYVTQVIDGKTYITQGDYEAMGLREVLPLPREEESHDLG